MHNEASDEVTTDGENFAVISLIMCALRQMLLG
jgi:hypothetical protein